MPVTPDTDPGRFTSEEAALFRAGLCSYPTGYGLPRTEYCQAPSDPDADFGYCTAHAGAAAES